jgi:hypothetical protein
MGMREEYRRAGASAASQAAVGGYSAWDGRRTPDPLGAGNALGINNKGQVVGDYGGADRVEYGFVATPAGAHSPATSSVQAAPSFGSTSPSATGSLKFDEASWMLSQDGDTRTLVKDPPVSGSLTPHANGGAAGSTDLFGISFGPNTTLGYSSNSER